MELLVHILMSRRTLLLSALRVSRPLCFGCWLGLTGRIDCYPLPPLQDAQPSIKTDVYSFGMTVFELFTRSEPYTVRHDS